MKIGLTGGIACGKSTVLKLFQQSGADVLDVDEIVRMLYRSDKSVQIEVKRKFGEAVFNPAGEVDRSKLAGIVFNDREALNWLEDLIHPRVRAYWMKTLTGDAQKVQVVEIPLLFEKNLEKYFNLTVCVACSLSKQVGRLRKKGLDEVQAKARIANQIPLKEKMRRADIVIINNGSIDFLKEQVALVFRQFG